MKYKKIIVYTVSVIIAFALIFGTMFIGSKIKANKMVKDFDKAFASKDMKMVFYARTTCYFCQLQKPILKNISKDYNLKYLNIDADYLTNKQKEHIINKLGVDGATPVTAIVKNNKVIAVHVGYLDGKEYVDFLKESGILPKDAIYKQEKYLTHINYYEFKTMENGILVLGANANQDSIDLRTSLNNIAKNNKITINYLNLSKTTKEEYYDIMNDLDYMNTKKYNLNDEEYDRVIIPLIIVIKDSKIVAISSELEENKVENLLKNI